MLNINISVITDFIKYFGERQIEEKAIQSGFTKRKDAKLHAATFLKAFTIGLWGINNVTLSKIIQVCEEIQDGLIYTKQALHQRLEPGSELMKSMFLSAMDFTLKKSNNVYSSGLLSKFNNIYICDATSICLPDKLRKYYGGHEGLNRDKKAFLKIQTMYNIATKGFKDIQVRKAAENDRKYLREVLGTFRKGDVIVYDLGFFSTDIFFNIAKAGSYYLSKVQNKTVFYSDMDVSDKKPLPIKDILKKNTDIVEINVFVGQKRTKRVPVRLIAERLPESIANEKIRKAVKKASRSKVTLTDYQRMMLSWNIVITNIPQDILSPKDALNLYKIRWQIEIMFKAWKSHINFEDVGLGGRAQQECILYGRLILITLMTTVYSQFYKIILSSKKQELSILKFFSLLRFNVVYILYLINMGTKSVIKLMDIFIKTSLKSLYEKRTRKTTFQLFGDYGYTQLENCG